MLLRRYKAYSDTRLSSNGYRETTFQQNVRATSEHFPKASRGVRKSMGSVYINQFVHHIACIPHFRTGPYQIHSPALAGPNQDFTTMKCSNCKEKRFNSLTKSQVGVKGDTVYLKSTVTLMCESISVIARAKRWPIYPPSAR